MAIMTATPWPSRWPPMAIMMATRGHCHQDGSPYGQARCHCHMGARCLTVSPAHGRGGVLGMWEGSFLPQLGEAETPAERIFSTVSLHARFHQKLARREAFQNASLRVCRARSACSHTLPAETCAKWPRGGARSASSHTLPAETCAKWLIRPPLREETHFEKLLSAHVSTGNLREEKLFKKFLSTQVSASPGRAKKEPSSPSCWPPIAIMRATHCHHDGNPWGS